MYAFLIPLSTVITPWILRQCIGFQSFRLPARTALCKCIVVSLCNVVVVSTCLKHVFASGKYSFSFFDRVLSSLTSEEY